MDLRSSALRLVRHEDTRAPVEQGSLLLRPDPVTHDSGSIHAVSEREEAWEAVHEALPAGWYVGRPSYHDERPESVMYAFDPSERPVVGLRSREWTAIAQTEEGVVCEMAGCLAGDHRRPGAAVAAATYLYTRCSPGIGPDAPFDLAALLGGWHVEGFMARPLAV